MTEFTPVSSLLGGVLIGLSAVVLLLVNGRIAGVSGIVSGMLEPPSRAETPWRAAFSLGLLGTGLALNTLAPEYFAAGTGRSLWTIGIAGVLVGIGVRMAGGCTSGHGVCGLGRLSSRSLVATLTFVAAGAVTVFMTRVLTGGAS